MDSNMSQQFNDALERLTKAIGPPHELYDAIHVADIHTLLEDIKRQKRTSKTIYWQVKCPQNIRCFTWRTSKMFAKIC